MRILALKIGDNLIWYGTLCMPSCSNDQDILDYLILTLTFVALQIFFACIVYWHRIEIIKYAFKILYASIFAFFCVPESFFFFLKLQIQFLFCPRNSNVGDLFVEALRSGQLDLPETGGTKKLRLLEIISNKIFTICGEEISLDVLLSAQVDNLYNFEGLLSLFYSF